jgi:hypothetical protein
MSGPARRRLHGEGRRAVHRHTADGEVHRLGHAGDQSANLDSYKDDLKALTGELQASFKDKFLACVR